jgi:hypothetical protein
VEIVAYQINDVNNRFFLKNNNITIKAKHISTSKIILAIFGPAA